MELFSIRIQRTFQLVSTPNDNSGADSHYGGRSIWACISTEGKSMLKRLTRKRKEQNI